MEIFQLPVIFGYLLISCYFFSSWLRFSLKHPSSCVDDKFLSGVMFLLTTVFWPLLLPISFIEIYKTRKLEVYNVVPVVIMTCAFALLYMRAIRL